MKFFKYLIFIFLLISFQAKADWYIQNLGPDFGVFTTTESACKANRDRVSSSFTYKLLGTSCVLYNGSSTFGVYELIEIEKKCTAGQTAFLDGYITPPDGFSPDSVCYQGCTWTNTAGGGTAFDTPNGNINWGFNAKNTGAKCSVETPKGEDKPVNKDGCKNNESYCDKPSTGCPSGYTSGSFNGKQICVKNNPDPTKPNPNDPNNGGGKGEGSCNGTNNCNTTNLDDTNIVNAINSSKNAITQAISSLSESITSSFTTVTNAINGTTNAVNNNTNAVNAVKSSVDALHNTINAVTTAVNNNTTAVTSAVNANTSATNAVKASVDALNSTVSAVTTAVDNNTKAVNANGDKVANAVKDNISATNAVKDAVSNLNSAVNAVSDAVNANGKNTVDAVNANGKNTVDAVNSVKSAIDSLNTSVNAVTSAINANGDKVSNSVNANGEKVTNAVNKGTETTKDNGKKLDQIIKGQEEGNSLLKDIKDWLTGDNNLPENEKPTIEEYDVGDYEKSYVSWSASCPPDVQIPISLMGQTSTLVLKWSPWCELLSKLRWAIIACAYFSAAYIILGMRG
ncbi:hypothetical protein L1A70_18365 [Acinetobacter bereziniae]|uniref:virulence factor TspB C-terminal domain-related protein n=1 Tax=Acinetobacter bereziniae TaxID=106648 RepID=UPI00376FC1AD